MSRPTIALNLLITVLFRCQGYLSRIQTRKQNSSQIASTIISKQPFNNDDYDNILKTYVNAEGMVDYKGLQRHPEGLYRFNAAIAQLNPDIYASWTDAEKIAFLINAYNAFTLQSIIAQNPLKNSILEILGVWGLPKFTIAGESKSLDNIEHDILRVQFNEPRIHAALVCAAKSCPPLRNEPYTPEKLDGQLDSQVRQFLASSQGFRIDRQLKRVYLSSIFKWYGKDWIKSYGVKAKYTGKKSEKAVLNFISFYLSPQDQTYLQQGDYKIKYLGYDWSLNKQ